jgi:ATP-binding cassette subfamily B protein
VLARRFNSEIHERTDAVQDQLGVLSARVQEHIAGMSVVRAYAMERPAMRTFAEANAEYLTRSLRLARLQAQFTPLISLVAGLGVVIVLIVGGRGIVDGRLTLGSLVAFNGYLAYLAWPTLALGWTLSVIRRGLTSMARIQEVFDAAPPPPPETESPASEVTAAPALAFRNVTFAYPGRPAALNDVTFDVKPGETVAVVGPTGSGKSTLGLLVARLWEPPAGTVTLDGVDVTTMPFATLRTQLGYVPQESFLFSRSILDNVTLGREGLAREGAREVADAAGIADEVERFPDGFDTVVGERGLTLSGGQRARVALARARAAGPPEHVQEDILANINITK